MNWDKGFLSPTASWWDNTTALPLDPTNTEENARLEGQLRGWSFARRIAIKRRMVGKFIGLRGCDTPIEEVAMKIWALEERIRQAVDFEMMRGSSKWV